MLRRRGEPDDLVPPTLEAGPVRMDVDRHVVSVDGEPVALPLKEFELLELLLRNAGRVLTRGQLIDRVWGSDYVGDTKTLDVHVKRLRAKVEPDPANPQHMRHGARARLQVRGLTGHGLCVGVDGAGVLEADGVERDVGVGPFLRLDRSVQRDRVRVLEGERDADRPAGSQLGSVRAGDSDLGVLREPHQPARRQRDLVADDGRGEVVAVARLGRRR